MKYKVFVLFTALMLLVSTTAWAAPSTSKRSGSFSTGKSPSTSNSGSSSKSGSTSNSTTPSGSGSSSSSGFSGGSSSKSTVPSTGSSGSSKNGTTYTTGSTGASKVNPYTGKAYSGGSTYTSSLPPKARSSSIWPVVGAFAAGSFLGSMLHPWGGYYPAYGGGYVHQPFSMMAMFLDLLLLAAVIWLGFRLYRSFARR